MKDYYKILEVDPDATEDEIKKSYHNLAYKFHPDKNSYERSEDLFSQIAEAYSILSDISKRKEYDFNRNQETFIELENEVNHQNGSTPVINPDTEVKRKRI